MRDCGGDATQPVSLFDLGMDRTLVASGTRGPPHPDYLGEDPGQRRDTPPHLRVYTDLIDVSKDGLLHPLFAGAARYFVSRVNP